MLRHSLILSPRTSCSGILMLISLSSCGTPADHEFGGAGQHAMVPAMREVHRRHLAADGPVDSTRPGTPASREIIEASGSEMQRPLQGIALPDKKGYVHSPYTNPGRVIDIRGFKTNDLVLCPYSRRTFVVPWEAVDRRYRERLLNSRSTAHQAMSSGGSPANEATASTEEVASPSGRKLTSTTKTRSIKPVSKKSPRKIRPATPPPVAPDPAPTAPSKKAPPTPAEDKAPVPAAPSPQRNPGGQANGEGTTMPPPPAQASRETPPPFGEHVPDKPGFVFSPFAEKHQLVEVKGLDPGTAIRCPYSYKIFRVPLTPGPSSGSSTR